MLQEKLSALDDRSHYAQLCNILDQSIKSYSIQEKVSTSYSSIVERFSHFNFMHSFSQQEKELFFNHIKIKHYFKGQTIYKREEECYDILFILKGTVKMAWNTESGKHVIHRFLPSGILLNIVYIMSDTLLEHDYIAHEATEVAVISGDVFKTLLQKNSKALYQVFEMVCKRARLLDNDIYHQNTQELKVQLARQLVYLVEYFSSQSQKIVKLNIKVSQENFAELLKTSRKSIKKELDWFVDEGIIETKYNQIYVINFERLKTII